MKKYVIALLITISSLGIFAQEITRNNIFLEGGGATGLYSVNYERLLRENNSLNFAFRIGLAYFPDHVHYSSPMVFPIGFSVLKNITTNHFIELRLAVASSLSMYEDWSNMPLGDTTNTFVPEKKFGVDILPSIGIGYRFQPKTKGLFANFLFQRILYISKEKWYGNISLGIGYAF